MDGSRNHHAERKYQTGEGQEPCGFTDTQAVRDRIVPPYEPMPSQ